MSWLPSAAEVAGHPGRAFAGGLVAFALVLFLVHGFPSGTGLNTPVDVYAVARFSRNSLLPRRQVALYVALATPAGTALLRAVEGQTVAQTVLNYYAARGGRGYASGTSLTACPVRYLPTKHTHGHTTMW